MESLHCLHREYNKKKKEYVYCKFPICKNQNNLSYCGNHLPLGEIGPNGKMMRCDICLQNIGSNILQRHIKKCQINKEKQISSVISNEEIITPRLWNKKNEKLCDLPIEIISNLKEKILNAYKSLEMNIESKILIDDAIERKFSIDELRGKNAKNLKQELSIYSNLNNEKYIEKNNNVFIEFGCGAASLSKTLQICCDCTSSYILIDRMKYNSRNKYDNLIKARLKNSAYIKREVIDIKDFTFEKYELDDNKYNVIVVSKHLCGSASELAMNKIVDYRNKISFGIATCCHYLIKSENYCNMDFITKIGFTEEEFNNMCRITAWGTLKEDNEQFKIGRYARLIIDYGRCLYLLDKGINTKMVKYTEMSKEDILLVGKREKLKK